MLESVASLSSDCSGTSLLLHIHASVCKDIAELVLENLRDENSLFFLCITFVQKVINVKPAKNEENALKGYCPF